MARPLRIEFEGAIYHVTSRGDRREPIYRDDADRAAHLDVIAQAKDHFDAEVLAYCLMGNHYHLVVRTRQANLSRLMRQLNWVYTQLFNRRHGLVGHLFQGRFKAILVDGDSDLLAQCRDVERNPVAAGLVTRASDWPWSSCRAHLGLAAAPPWLDVTWLDGFLLQRSATTTFDMAAAAACYAALVDMAMPDESSIWQQGLRQQVYLGDAASVERMLALATARQRAAPDVPKPQRQSPRTWPECLALSGHDRNQALRMAYREGGMTMTALAQAVGLSVSRVSRLIAAAKAVTQVEGPGAASTVHGRNDGWRREGAYQCPGSTILSGVLRQQRMDPRASTRWA